MPLERPGARTTSTGRSPRPTTPTRSDEFDPGVVGATVDFLAELAGDGAALELGIGTGRIALPLGPRGVPVQGIDLRPTWWRNCRRNPGQRPSTSPSATSPRPRCDGTFRLAYLVYNTIENLTSQDDQVACFINVADTWSRGVLRRRGEVPPLRRLPPGESTLGLPRHRGPAGFRHARRGPAARGVPPLLGRRRTARCSPCPTATSGPPSST